MTITGTRSVSTDGLARLGGLFAEYLGPFATADAHFHLGGAAGIDTLALDWLAEHTKTALTVVVPCGVADQPEAAAGSVTRWQRAGRLAEVVELGASRLDAAAYHARNRWMVDRSGFVVGFPENAGQGSGTWYTLDYAAGQGKPRLVVPI
ncbi:hypothetical protein GCM10010428_71010 [Actinosynnema pretiosum subsp. pretiosum]